MVRVDNDTNWSDEDNPHPTLTAHGCFGLLGVNKVDEGVADVTLVFEVHSQIQEVELSKVGLVDTLEKHWLFSNIHEQQNEVITCLLFQQYTTCKDLVLHCHTWVYLLGIFRIMNVVRLSEAKRK